MRSRFFYLHLIFWIGFTALIYEIYSVHVLFLFIVETTHAAALAISSFLAGLACSSLVFTKVCRDADQRARERLLIAMQLFVAAYAWMILARYDWIPLMADAIEAHIQQPGIAALARLGVVWIYLFVPAFFIGGAFPIVNGFYQQPASDPIVDTGRVYFSDVAGSIVGALLAGFYLLPSLGLRATIVLPTIINLLLATALLRRSAPRLALLGIVVALSGYEVYGRNVGFTAGDTRVHFAGEAALERRFGTVLFQEPSRYGTVTVGVDPRMPAKKTMFINYRDMCRSGSRQSEIGMASIVNRFLEPRSSILNIGLGCGFTADEIAAHPSVAKLGIVEINPVVAKASRSLFRVENHGVQENPKTTLMLMDGATFLRTHAERFDAILIDIEEVTVVYSSPLYTREYFEIVKTRLTSGGIFALWSFYAGDAMSKVLLNTMRTTFPNVRIGFFDHAMVFFGSDRPLDAIASDDVLDREAIERIETTPIQEINTLDHRRLESYYDMRAVFRFPAEYRERFVRDPVRGEP